MTQTQKASQLIFSNTPNRINNSRAESGQPSEHAGIFSRADLCIFDGPAPKCVLKYLTRSLGFSLSLLLFFLFPVLRALLKLGSDSAGAGILWEIREWNNSGAQIIPLWSPFGVLLYLFFSLSLSRFCYRANRTNPWKEFDYDVSGKGILFRAHFPPRGSWFDGF